MTSADISVIFFCVGVVAVTPVLYYYYKRNPHPRFRPAFGEMVMISIFALFFIGGGSVFMGTILSSNPKFNDNALKTPITNRDTEPSDQGTSNSRSGGSKKSLLPWRN